MVVGMCQGCREMKPIVGRGRCQPCLEAKREWDRERKKRTKLRQIARDLANGNVTPTIHKPRNRKPGLGAPVVVTDPSGSGKEMYGDLVYWTQFDDEVCGVVRLRHTQREVAFPKHLLVPA